LDPVVETEKRIGNFRVNRKVEWGKDVTEEPRWFARAPFRWFRREVGVVGKRDSFGPAKPGLTPSTSFLLRF
jgi:hypothetical protein